MSGNHNRIKSLSTYSLGNSRKISLGQPSDENTIKWNNPEEKEKSLVLMNKEAIKRYKEPSQIKRVDDRINKVLNQQPLNVLPFE